MIHVSSSANFSPGSGSPTSDDPPSFEDASTEDSKSESEDESESDGVYDEFDLGDFTKEEIKIYEAMVDPEERLRSAAPPEKSVAEMLEDSCERYGIGWGNWLTA